MSSLVEDADDLQNAAGKLLRITKRDHPDLMPADLMRVLHVMAETPSDLQSALRKINRRLLKRFYLLAGQEGLLSPGNGLVRQLTCERISFNRAIGELGYRAVKELRATADAAPYVDSSAKTNLLAEAARQVKRSADVFALTADNVIPVEEVKDFAYLDNILAALLATVEAFGSRTGICKYLPDLSDAAHKRAGGYRRPALKVNRAITAYGIAVDRHAVQLRKLYVAVSSDITCVRERQKARQ